MSMPISLRTLQGVEVADTDIQAMVLIFKQENLALQYYDAGPSFVGL
ncbi:MAG: hypothetical protein ACLRSL_06965 [Streptococcus sp.]